MVLSSGLVYSIMRWLRLSCYIGGFSFSIYYFREEVAHYYFSLCGDIIKEDHMLWAGEPSSDHAGDDEKPPDQVHQDYDDIFAADAGEIVWSLDADAGAGAALPPESSSSRRGRVTVTWKSHPSSWQRQRGAASTPCRCAAAARSPRSPGFFVIYR